MTALVLAPDIRKRKRKEKKFCVCMCIEYMHTDRHGFGTVEYYYSNGLKGQPSENSLKSLTHSETNTSWGGKVRRQ